MKIVFAGPSIFGAEIDTTGIDLRGPALQGDLTQAVSDGATVIGLIDGAFSSVAAVWHKEILFALSQGVRVYGASSMGALRAAECATFGMIPVGKIARAYLDGELDDDAAVALTMGPAEWGWQAVTEPLVDVWATLDHLRSLGEVDVDQHTRLLSAAAALHFTVRTPDAIITRAFPLIENQSLLEAYDRCHVSQKQMDAVELINLIRAIEPPTSHPSWRFEASPMWRSFLATDA